MRRRKGAATGIAAGLGVLALAAMSLGTPNACGLSSQEFIGPEGGELLSEDGRLSLEIPEGALSEPTEVSIEEIPCEDPGRDTCYAVGPGSVHFQLPVTVVYEAGELASMDEVSLLYLGAQGWMKMADAQIDREDEIVIGTIMFASEITIDAR